MALTEDRFLQLMEEMNKKQIKKIEDRVAEQLSAVRSDISEAIDKVSGRQDNLENEQKELKNTVHSMQEKLYNLAKVVSDEKRSMSGSLTYAAAAAHIPGASVPHSLHPRTAPAHGGDGGGLDPEVAEIIDRARRTVGLSTIDSDDLTRMRQVQFGGATTEEEEKLLAVKEYLKCELKIRSEDIEKI